MIVSRRNFLRNAAGVVIAPTVLAACNIEAFDSKSGERFMSAFLHLLADRNVGAAYALTGDNFRKRYSIVSFATLIYNRGLDGPVSQRWLNRAWSQSASFGSSRANFTLSGWLVNRRYERLPAWARIEKANGKVLLDQMEIAAHIGSKSVSGALQT